MDDVVYLAALCGYSISENNPRHIDNPNHNINYRSNVLSRTQCIVNNRDRVDESLVHYSGRVYCVTVPSGMVMTRRNGKQLVCGNSPFAHTSLSFRISAPLFVARQLAKHVVGLCWNEMSRRYIESAPCFYAPDEWRGRAIDVKQGSGGAIENQWLANEVYHEAMRVMDDAYLQLLDIGVAPEQARMILPQSMLTTWIWTGSLYAFARVCRLRLDHHAQMETQQVAQEIAVHCERIFPVSWPSLMGELKA